MRRFLISLIFVGSLSVVFSISAFASTDYVDSPYMGSGQSTFNHTVSYSVNAEDGDSFYFDVSVSKGNNIILNPSGINISAQVSNKYFDYSYSVHALGTNYGFGTVQTEGNRVWVFADRPVSSITVTYQVTISYSWRSGTFNGSPVQDLSQCIARCPFNVTTGDIIRSGTNWPTDIVLNDKLDAILDSLNVSTGDIDFLGDDAIFYLRPSYFSSYWTSNGSITSIDPVYSLSVSDAWVYFYNYEPDRIVDIALQPGYYYLYLSAPSDSTIFRFGFSDYFPSFELVSTTSHNDFSNFVYKFYIESPLAANTFILQCTVNGMIYGGVEPLTGDVLLGDSINPGQDGMVSDVDDAGKQQTQQEDQMWQNINTYKGDISFSLDGWDDAAGGLSYVTGVFMTIWNNSPTQPIVLSLMLGIAMLSIGRGVMAAVRVSRNRGDD